MVVTDHITMYDGDTLIWGTEPDGKTPVVTTPTTKPAVTTTTTTTTTTSSATVTSEEAPVTTPDVTTTIEFGKGSYSFDLDDLGLNAGDQLVLHLQLLYYDGAASDSNSYSNTYTVSGSWKESASGTLEAGINDITLTAAEAMDHVTVSGTTYFADVNLKDYEIIRAGSTTTTTPAVVDPDMLYGDINLDGKVGLVDAVLLNKAVADVVTLNDQARKNADCNANGEVNGEDSIVLLQFLVQIIDVLPFTE